MNQNEAIQEALHSLHSAIEFLDIARREPVTGGMRDAYDFLEHASRKATRLLEQIQDETSWMS